MHVGHSERLELVLPPWCASRLPHPSSRWMHQQVMTWTSTWWACKQSLSTCLPHHRCHRGVSLGYCGCFNHNNCREKKRKNMKHDKLVLLIWDCGLDLVFMTTESGECEAGHIAELVWVVSIVMPATKFYTPFLVILRNQYMSKHIRISWMLLKSSRYLWFQGCTAENVLCIFLSQ